MTAGSRREAPFYSRAYAGFSQAQIDFVNELHPRKAGLTIADPMCGQALDLGQWALEGARIHCAEINPGALALAALRCPTVLASREYLTRGLQILLPKRRRGSGGFEASSEWLPVWAASQLETLGRAAGIEGAASLERSFTAVDPFQRFVLGIVALAARRIVTFRATKNPTWLRPGGVARYSSVAEPIEWALEQWNKWAVLQECIGQSHPIRFRLGDLRRIRHPPAALVVTSPPYANRLNYSRLWLPERLVTGALAGTYLGPEDTGSIGSNAPRETDAARLATIPGIARAALARIRRSPAYASERYYYPFFAAYAVELSEACRVAASIVQSGGTLVMFGRDTARKDVLFPTRVIALEACRSEGLTLITRRDSVIRSHVGNVRLVSDTGLLGRAQREWWLALRRP